MENPQSAQPAAPTVTPLFLLLINIFAIAGP